ncbi:hypothetical protein Btru_045825 [Bulinus truncatus]|nr:hypothetical protein Btru_045825 [Bulinus truncatus]
MVNDPTVEFMNGKKTKLLSEALVTLTSGGLPAAEMIAISSTRFTDQTLLWLTTVYILTYTLVFSEVTTGNEDGDQLYQSKSQKPLAEMGPRLYEGPNGIPVSIDGLFLQISSYSQDDLGHVGSTECLHGSHLSELDMCVTPSQAALFESQSHHQGIRNRRQASANGFSLWKNGVIPYVFNSTFPTQDRDAILGAMSEWEKATCIRFRLATVQDTDIVVFRDGRRCSTNIGRIGREQVVTLAKSCRSKRILIHELGHVIGLIHEHQRHDRDKYVKVILENVRNMSQERYQFSKLLSGSITDKTVKYDYTSVMHYGRNSPELTTLQTTDGRYQDIIGRAERPSFSDIETVNRLYHCSAGCNQYLQCSDNCYLDNTCTCRCSPVTAEKPVLTGQIPHRNTLQDSTCEYFASRGECNGNIKETVRSLCARSCGIIMMKLTPQQQQHQPWPHHASAAATATTQTKPNWDQAQPDPLGAAAARSAGGHRSNDINVVSDIPMVMNGDPTVPVVAVQSGLSSQQLRQISLSGHQAYLHNYNLDTMANVQSHLGIEVNHHTQHAGPGLAATYRGEASQQKQASPSPEASNLLRSLILSRTEPSPVRIGTIPDQSNSYTEYAGSTKPPIKTSINSAMPTVHLIRSPPSSNWLHQSSLQYQILQQQQLSHQLSMQQQQNYMLYQQSRLNNNQGRISPSSGYVHRGNTDALQREITLIDRQNRINFQNHGHNVRHNLNHNGYQYHETTFGQIVQKSRENIHDPQMMQTAGVERSGATSPLADFTGANIGSDHNPNVAPHPDSSRNLQTIGPSFMKSGHVPPDYMPSEPVSPLGSPVEQINVDVPGRPTIDQQQLSSVYFSGSPHQSFEPAFSLTDPASSQRWPTGMSVWESIIHRINKQQSSLNSGPTVDTPSQPVTSIDQISFTNSMVSQTISPQNTGSLENIPNINVDGNINQQNQQQWLRAQQLQPQMIPENIPVHHMINSQLSLTDPNPQMNLPSIPTNFTGSWFAAPSNIPYQENTANVMANHQSPGNIPPQGLMFSINSNRQHQDGGSLFMPSDAKLYDFSFFPFKNFISNYTSWNGDAQHQKYFQLFPTKAISSLPVYRDKGPIPFDTSQPSDSNGQYHDNLQFGSTTNF